ncbi:hypothetical protein Tco_0642069 [Tanacetum coccineum]
MEIESLATKYPIVDWKTHVLTENFMYYQIFRADGSFKNYKIFSEMLDDFDRQDVLDLHRLVKARYMTSSPEGYDLMLWGDLKILFEPDEEDEVWRNQHEYNLISWRLFDSCGIHILLMNNGIAIHMMIEKKYPLTQEMLSKMLSRKLGDHEMRWHFKLLGFIRSQYALDILTPDAIRFGGCLQIAVCLLHHSAVSYTSVTLIPSSRVFWGADEEISDGGPEEPQTPPVPQDEDELSELGSSITSYFDSPTAESPGYVAESDPEEYEDDETEDGPVTIPMDGGEDRDDDDGDSSGDDADDEDEDEEDDEEEEEHLAPADSAVVVPTASISLPPEAEVERLLAMPTSPPSPPISLSPPSAGELARCTAPSAHSSQPPVPSPLLPSLPVVHTKIQTLRIASTQALVNAVTAALPSPPLPPSLCVPPPVDYRDDILESELPPRKRSCLSTLGPKYEVGESSTARPTTSRGIDYGFVSTVDAEAR